jgi:GDP-4-dehydro-6-deoxy-D-mannose reductase
VRALVFGADGFAGRWLTKHLADGGDIVLAAAGPRSTAAVPYADENVSLDVTDRAAVATVVGRFRPEVAYYLAGVSQRGSRDAVASAVDVTVIGSLNVLVALADDVPGARLVFVSSGYVYGPSSRARREEDEPAPVGVYAAAKLAAELALGSMAPEAGVHLVIARPFNHIGPGQRPGFLVPTVASQLRDVAAGQSRVIKVGSTGDIRDFTDVRDVVTGYRLIAQAGAEGSVYNIASGTGHRVRSVIEIMMRLAGVEAEVQSVDESDVRIESLVGDASRLETLGWSRQYSLEDSLRAALLEHMPGLANS